MLRTKIMTLLAMLGALFCAHASHAQHTKLVTGSVCDVGYFDLYFGPGGFENPQYRFEKDGWFFNSSERPLFVVCPIVKEDTRSNLRSLEVTTTPGVSSADCTIGSYALEDPGIQRTSYKPSQVSTINGHTQKLVWNNVPGMGVALDVGCNLDEGEAIYSVKYAETPPLVPQPR